MEEQVVHAWICIERALLGKDDVPTMSMKGRQNGVRVGIEDGVRCLKNGRSFFCHVEGSFFFA